MTHMPGIPVKFDEPDEWKSTGRVCNEFQCQSCKHTWWVDGIDS